MKDSVQIERLGLSYLVTKAHARGSGLRERWGWGWGKRKSLLRHGWVSEPVLLRDWRHFLQPLWAKLSIPIFKTHLTTGLGERARDVAIERLGAFWGAWPYPFSN